MEGTKAMTWRKSTYSNGGENCVETTSDAGVVLVRDTTNRGGGTLSFDAAAWAKFTKSL